jgi:hypothetical protein
MKKTWKLKPDRGQYIVEFYQGEWLVKRQTYETHREAVDAGIAWSNS